MRKTRYLFLIKKKKGWKMLPGLIKTIGRKQIFITTRLMSIGVLCNYYFRQLGCKIESHPTRRIKGGKLDRKKVQFFGAKSACYGTASPGVMTGIVIK